MSYAIPFNRPCLAGNEYKYIAEAIANGHASGDGPFTKRCHELLKRELGSPGVLLTTSCTHALEMAALLLDCGPGDEVIVPSFTFVSSVSDIPSLFRRFSSFDSAGTLKSRYDNAEMRRCSVSSTLEVFTA